jgi:hypothetical protein
MFERKSSDFLRARIPALFARHGFQESRWGRRGPRGSRKTWRAGPALPLSQGGKWRAGPTEATIGSSRYGYSANDKCEVSLDLGAVRLWAPRPSLNASSDPQGRAVYSS